MPDAQLNEIGFYCLAGAPKSPVELLDEVSAGEALGLGSAFISERFNIKEAATLSGAVGAVSSTLGIATAATNHNTRHPIVTASYATTMHRLTGGRFTLGLGRGIAPMFDAFGIPRITTAQLEDFVGLMRRLFRGEVVFGHDGPAGKWPVLHLDASFDEDIPIGFVAFGPNSLAFAGRAVDMVVLHTFFTDETTERCVRAVRESAEKAGRDPASVRIWSCYATVHDGLPEPLRLKKTVGRLASYLQGYGDLLVETNGWDPAPLTRFRADPVVTSVSGAIDQNADTAALEHIAGVLPPAWLDAAATGTPQRCAARVLRQFDLGVDGVIMHGATPDELAPVIAAYRSMRPEGRFDGLDPEPGALTNDAGAGVAAGVEDLTPGWLSAALGVEVTDVGTERIGTGQMGATYRLQLRYGDRSDGPAQLVAKLAATDPVARARVAAGYRKEVSFYSHVAALVDIRVPRCYYFAIAPDDQTFTLLLEDCRGAVTGVQADGCSVEAAAAAVVNLAGLHAPRWHDPALKELDCLQLVDATGADFLASLLRDATGSFTARYRTVLSRTQAYTLRAAAEATAAWLTTRLEPYSPTHGDYRLDNLLFAPDGEVIAVDWQTLALAPPARDLAYFLGTSLEIDARRSHERHLVSLYHRTLVDKGVRDYDVDTCFEDYRLGQLQGPLVTILGCELATGVRTPSVDGMFLAMATRSSAAIEDLGTLDLLPRL